MKVGVIYFGVVFAYLACVYGQEREFYNVEEAPQLFVKYINDYNKSYNDYISFLRHYEAFKKSLNNINYLNKESTMATFGLNKFADYTPEELENLHGLSPLRLN